jgi:hypothetical protein
VARGDGEGRTGDATQQPRMPPLRTIDIFRTLARHGVEYVVIGGYSLAAHGVVRGTKDLDIFPEPSPQNLQRLLAALREMDAEIAGTEDFEEGEWPVSLDREGLAAGGNWILRTRYGRLDLMQSLRVMQDYAPLRARAVERDIPDLAAVENPVLFAGLDDLVAMKRDAGRDQDLIDIGDLERAQGKPL